MLRVRTPEQDYNCIWQIVELAQHIMCWGKYKNGRKMVAVQSSITTVSRYAHWLLERSQFIHSKWSQNLTHTISWKWHEEMPGPGSCIACSVDDPIMKATTGDRRWCKVEKKWSSIEGIENGEISSQSAQSLPSRKSLICRNRRVWARARHKRALRWTFFNYLINWTVLARWRQGPDFEASR